MAKVFSEQKGRSPGPKRNAYDHSNQVLITGNYGDLMVVNAFELNPGESIKIDDVVAIRSHPVVFPVQTRIKAYLHYFAVRQRLLCDDFEDMITGLDTSKSNPYIKYTETQAKRLMKTGSLFDHLGLPTTVASNSIPVKLKVNVTPLRNFLLKNSSTYYTSTNIASYTALESSYPVSSLSYIEGQVMPYFATSGSFLGIFRKYTFDDDVVSLADLLVGADNDLVSSPTLPTRMLVYVDGLLEHSYQPTITANSDGCATISIDSDTKDLFLQSKSSGSEFAIVHYWAPVGQNINDLVNADRYSSVVVPYFGNVLNSFASRSYFDPLFMDSLLSSVIDATDDRIIANNPFVSHGGADPVIPLSAMFPRAYEMIYNYYYRNSQNNPYNPTGNKVEYSKFLPSTSSGPDSNEYYLHRRNWELDPYTSAVPSPQFGDAPLVGVNYSGGHTAEFVFDVTNSETQQVEQLRMRVGVDEHGVLQTVESFDEGIPSGNLRNVLDLATYGFSINTLRNANAFQLFFEDTYQHPLRYRDQLKAHFGVSPDYPDVDVPEFIGGTSGELVVSQVTNMSESDNAPLGDIAGKVDAVFKCKHPIQYHTKAEHVIILGILSIVPVPTYSQLLPKKLTRFKTFDFFQRRFSKIGYVPIFRSELMPLQSQDPDEVFGYQRAWYEYMYRPNEVHGDFRTSLRDFVLQRIFNDEPQLNPNFTIVDPDSVTNIFQTDGIQDKYGSSDKFMIQVYHDASYLSIVPKYARAALE